MPWLRTTQIRPDDQADGQAVKAQAQEELDQAAGHERRFA
jgi:hypothetical protein